MNDSRLVIEIPYGGLGDHLFHTPIPRMAKEHAGIREVLISTRSLYRAEDYRKIAWDFNPYVDGFVDEEGVSCDLNKITAGPISGNRNLLDEVITAFGFETEQSFSEPEIYYEPNFREEYHLNIFDPNFISWVGQIDKSAMMKALGNYDIDAVMKLRSDQALFIPDEGTKFIDTPTLLDFCDLIHSCRHMYCLTSGTSTIAAGLKKPATVFFGKEQSLWFQHSKLHKYVLVEQSFYRKSINKLKNKLGRG